MPQPYRKIRPLAWAAAVLVALGAGGLALLPHTPAGGAPGAGLPLPRVDFRRQMIEDREEGELLVNGRVAVCIRTAAAGYTASERARMAAQRLQRALEEGAGPQDLTVQRTNNQVVIAIGNVSLITVDELHAAINGTKPERLAEIWRSQIQEALQPEVSRVQLENQLEAAGISDPQTRLPVTWRTLQNNREGYWQGQAVYPEFKAESQAGAALVRFANADLARAARAALDRYAQEAAESVADRGRPTEAYAFDLKSTVALFRPEVLSVFYETYAYTGGAHGNTTFTALNYALRNGEPTRLPLQPLFKPDVDARRVASDRVIRQLKENPRADWVRDGSITELSEEMAERFVLTPTGVSFLFQPYDVAPYAAGSFVVKVPFAEFGDQLDPRGSLGPLLREQQVAQATGAAVTPDTQTGGSATPPWEDTEPLADKFVPILSVGTGVRLGVARVSGPKTAVDTVQAVAQIEGEYKRIARGRAFVPVATEDVIKSIERVNGVSVTGYADLRF